MSYAPVLVRVWNDNIYPYREVFREKEISINAGKFIEMEMMEANEFLGRFTGIVKDGEGEPDPRYFKKLRIERTSKVVPPPAGFEPDLTCQACGFRGKNKKELDQHIDENHMDIMVDEKEKERRMKESPHAKSVLP